MEEYQDPFGEYRRQEERMQELRRERQVVEDRIKKEFLIWNVSNPAAYVGVRDTNGHRQVFPIQSADSVWRFLGGPADVYLHPFTKLQIEFSDPGHDVPGTLLVRRRGAHRDEAVVRITVGQQAEFHVGYGPHGHEEDYRIVVFSRMAKDEADRWAASQTD